MKKDLKKDLIDAFLLGFAGWYWRMKWWKKRMDMWEKGEYWKYWGEKKGKRYGKRVWWEKIEK
jgi:hypothetical protein